LAPVDIRHLCTAFDRERDFGDRRYFPARPAPKYADHGSSLAVDNTILGTNRLTVLFLVRSQQVCGQGGKHAETPMWQATFNSAAHCGAGCALGDFIGTWIVFATGVTLFGSEMGSNYLITFMLAYAFGVVFQYFAVAPMRGLDLRRGLISAIKIDTLSLLAYQIGMFAFMGFQSRVYPDQQPISLSFWLLMQIAMVLGFATTYPVNWWLIRRGIKEKM
jgi:Domain of unknown function (DUF4396)